MRCKKPEARAARHSDESVLNAPLFFNTAQKIPEMRQHSGNFVVCLEKSCHFKTAQHL